MTTCYGCADRKRDLAGNLGSGRVGNDPVFTDSRTGRSFCCECVLALVTWELDGCPDPDEYPYRDWIHGDKPKAGSWHENYECDDCGWPWPLSTAPKPQHACDHCGGDLVPSPTGGNPDE